MSALGSAALMRTLYLEPFAGMAGDMLLAALLDLGDPRFGLEDLRRLADALVPGECTLELSTAWRGNLSGKHLDVKTPESARPPHRTYADLERMVRQSPLSRAAQDRACAILMRIAVAEAHVHGTTPDQIHFHEIGAVDTLIDVCGAVLALERLAVERVVTSPPVTGTGTVHCAHGEMPVPAPAALELLRGKPIVIGGGRGERLTPTGAALLVELADSFESPGGFVTERVGYGAGTRDPKDGPPNILRVQLGDSAGASAGRAEAWLLEVNLDDMTGEEIAHAAERLRDAGALDVWTVPVQMKKNRPGVVLSALCRAGDRGELERVVFAETTTLGLRWQPCERRESGRRTVEVDVEGQRVRVKVRELPGRAVEERDLSPEHDDVASAAVKLGRSARDVERAAIALAWSREPRQRSSNRS